MIDIDVWCKKQDDLKRRLAVKVSLWKKIYRAVHAHDARLLILFHRYEKMYGPWIRNLNEGL